VSSLLKADLHVHTRYSEDSISPPDKIVQHCLKTGINCVAITDHNEISGAFEVKRIAPFKVIVGEEILSNQGEIIGYFLTEKIPPRLSPEETVARIKAQGGLVCIPHPFDLLRSGTKIHKQALEEILPNIDLIEVFNSKTVLLRYSQRALELAQKRGLPGTAGSDAHVVREIGSTYMEIPEFNDTEQFLQSVRQGKVFGHRTSLWMHFYIGIRNRLVKQFQRTGSHV
jgi:predicted metal-dependent phosphoesterase TrpH